MAPAPQAAPAHSLVHHGLVLAPAEVATTRSGRRRGLLGRDELDGVFVLDARSVHTVGMRFAIDVAFCDAELRVRRLLTLVPGRLTRVHLRCSVAVEAPAGAFERWDVRVGDRLELRPGRTVDAPRTLVPGDRAGSGS